MTDNSTAQLLRHYQPTRITVFQDGNIKVTEIKEEDQDLQAVLDTMPNWSGTMMRYFQVFWLESMETFPAYCEAPGPQTDEEYRSLIRQAIEKHRALGKMPPKLLD